MFYVRRFFFGLVYLKTKGFPKKEVVTNNSVIICIEFACREINKLLNYSVVDYQPVAVGKKCMLHLVGMCVRLGFRQIRV